MPDDSELIAGLRRQDRVQQRRFVERYFGGVFRFYRVRFGMPAEEAEEVTSDVLATILASPERFDPERGVPLSAWVLRVAANRGKDWARKVSRRPEEVPLRTDLVCEVGVSDGGVSGPMAEAARIVVEALEELTEEQRAIIAWHAHGVPHGMIAEWTGKTESAVRQIVSRGKRRIRRRFEERLPLLEEPARSLIRRWLEGLTPAGVPEETSDRGTTKGKMPPTA